MLNSIPALHFPDASSKPRPSETTKKCLQTLPMSRGAAWAEIHCSRQPMTLHLGENGWAKILLSHTMASLATERKPPNPLKQLCDFHVPAGRNLISLTSIWRVREGPTEWISPCGVQAAMWGCRHRVSRWRAEGGWHQAASAPWKGHRFRTCTGAQRGLAAALLGSQQPSGSSFPGWAADLPLRRGGSFLWRGENQWSRFSQLRRMERQLRGIALFL